MPEQTAIEQKTSLAEPVVITTQTVIDEIIAFFGWWYIEMPIWYIGLIQRIATICDDTLSISLLLKTFFVPWHRDRTWVGYFIGIMARIIYLPIAIVITLTILTLLILVATAWALLPPVTIFFILKTPFT
ncbi:hypothetical protein JW710_00405 [Candidatus Dojkabacteria bacterium]|nr:hypothetical protein [Candidatus Dojkabacteria bacterium]